MKRQNLFFSIVAGSICLLFVNRLNIFFQVRFQIWCYLWTPKGSGAFINSFIWIISKLRKTFIIYMFLFQYVFGFCDTLSKYILWFIVKVEPKLKDWNYCHVYLVNWFILSFVGLILQLLWSLKCMKYAERIKKAFLIFLICSSKVYLV